MRYSKPIALLSAALLTAACHQHAGTPGTALVAANPHAGPPAGVAWFGGGLPQAFTEAEQQHKPVFVYFGAVWCPPCQELKATLFKRKDFLDRVKLFVPVYLDGDAPEAQRWAESFGARAYPTVLILRSDRSEIERVTGGMNLKRYSDILDEGVKAVRPIKEILANVGKGAALDINDCRIIAYDNWQLDEGWDASDLRSGWLDHTADLLARGAEHCPSDARTERARLEVTAAYAAVLVDADNVKTGKSTNPRLIPDVERVGAVLADPALAGDIGDLLLDAPTELFTTAAKLEPATSAGLRIEFFSVMDGLESDSRYSTATQLFATYRKIAVAKATDGTGEPQPAVAEQARQRVDAALSRVQDPGDRAGVINAALNILDELGDDDRVYSLLENEIKTSPTPYYYMSDMAELEEKRGHKQAAVDWLARSYRDAQGPATRLQWGSRYIKGLIRLKPEDETAIRIAVLQVLGEARGADSLYGRNRRSLDGVAEKLHEWNRDGKHAAVIADLRAAVDRSCKQSSLSDSSRSACGDVLAKI